MSFPHPIFTGPGFEIEGTFIQTGGKVGLDATYEIGDAVSPAQLADPIGARFGIDFEFPGDLVETGAGDLKLTQDVEGFRAVLARGKAPPTRS